MSSGGEIGLTGWNEWTDAIGQLQVMQFHCYSIISIKTFC